MSVDPLSAASALATIVQLIALFRQQSGTRKDLTHREFIEWLDAHRHDEILNVQVTQDCDADRPLLQKIRLR
jgi:hypothetical protein